MAKSEKPQKFEAINLLTAQNCLSLIEIEASKLERDSDALQQALKQLGNYSLLALKVPLSLGGSGFSQSDYGLWQIAIAEYSGALAFLQTQHQSAGSLLTASKNNALQQELLPHMSAGNRLVGVGFSQLRRAGKPLVTAKATNKGYLISGIVPWITGGHIFTDFIIGATLPDGKELYALVPLQNRDRATGGKITLSPPMDLMAMKSTNTVSAELDNWFLTQEYIVAIKPANSIHQSSKKNVLSHSYFSLGCAYSALNTIEQIYQSKPLDFIIETQKALQQEANKYQRQILNAMTSENATYKDKLELRSQVINLASRCTQAAIITASGAANNLSNAAGRVYREALVFSVSGQTTDVMAASLRLLV